MLFISEIIPILSTGGKKRTESLHALCRKFRPEDDNNTHDVISLDPKPKRVKVTVIGEPCVGKTSLVQRMADNSFSFCYIPTFGVNRTMIQSDDKDGKPFLFSVIDTSDVLLDPELAVNMQDRLDASHASFSDIVVIVYDITDHKSFEYVKDWTRLTKEFLQTDARLILIGNKADRTKRREVHQTAGEVFALLNNMDFLETSCLDRFNLHNLWTLMMKR